MTRDSYIRNRESVIAKVQARQSRQKDADPRWCLIFNLCKKISGYRASLERMTARVADTERRLLVAIEERDALLAEVAR